MTLIVTCNICKETKTVNGQKQVTEFAKKHTHNDPILAITGSNIEIEQPK